MHSTGVHPPGFLQSADTIWLQTFAKLGEVENLLNYSTMMTSKNGGSRGGVEFVGHADVSIIRIPPHHYIHVLDQNTNIARVEIGPLTYIRQNNENVCVCVFI
ncbi:unnamed protein product [Oncorhynchus mykiss]|uniref:Uncharacterized protein n=1 Tax=Oncorhynchus mykiss TaxID=8022 RepID=A0A060XJ55_ONCMY|nr:unnamed protein product [Oncorhynchus mykiss]